MQTTPANNTSSDPDAPSPTTAQVHQAQLLDYELLLSALQGEVGSLSQFSQTLLRPSAFSPLEQENEIGQGALQELLKDPDYLALCRSKKVSPHYLVVTLKEGAFVYETSNREGADKTELTLTDNAKWQALRARIEKSVPLLSGQIRYDRLVSVPRIATFYALAPWDSSNATEHQAAIDALREKIASYKLGLEEDFNLLDLKPDLTDRLKFVSYQSVLQTDLQEEMNNQFITEEIKRTIRAFLPDGVTSPLSHLANDFIATAKLEEVRARPTVFLKRILQGPSARILGDRLLAALDWYGGKPDEDSAPHIRTKVLANALQIWFEFQAIAYPDRIAGFDLHSSSNGGKSYKNIWREFETHLLASKRAASEIEAIILARLFLRQFPAEFRVSNIPSDLPYKGSIVWVNFVNGVNLIKADDPARLSRMTFQQLAWLPINQAEGATAEQLNDIALARLLPTLDWAANQGIIPEKQREDYTQAEIELAVSELDKHTDALAKAITEFDALPPERLELGKRELEKLFPINNFRAAETLKLAKFDNSAKPRDTPVIKGQQFRIYSFLDVYASGKLTGNDKWFVVQLNGTAATNVSYSINKNRKIQIDSPSVHPFHQRMAGKELPDLEVLFDTQFRTYVRSLREAYRTLILNQLASLPINGRQALEQGELRVYTLRKATTGQEAENETAEMLLPLRARAGFFIQAIHDGKTLWFELLPRAGIIRSIPNIDSGLIGGERTTESWKVSKGPAVRVSVLRHKTLPFDWDAHAKGSVPKADATCQGIIEPLGQPLSASSAPAKNHEIPRTLSSSRIQVLTYLISLELLFIDENALRIKARGETELEREEARGEKALEIGKMFIPFWSSVDDLASGDRNRMVNGVFGLFTDLLTFAPALGKFASGTAKLISNAGRLSLGTRLPAFASLTKQLLISTLQALNPLDGVGDLLRALGSKGLKVGRSSLFKMKTLAGRAGRYNFVDSLPKIENAGRWNSLTRGTALATVRGVDDVPLRNLSSAGKADYRLIDPISSRPYGPRLSPDAGEISFGRSEFLPVGGTDKNTVFNLPEEARVYQIPEIDGRTTLLIDGTPYRLDQGALRRVDSIDASDTFQVLPCRLRRAPDEVCLNSYVHRQLSPAPLPGSHDPVEDFCPWFGDRIYTPAPVTQRRKAPVLALDGQLYTGTGETLKRFTGKRSDLGLPNRLTPKARLDATIEFHKGMYGRIRVKGVYEGLNDDMRQVSTLIIESKIDPKKEYLFTQLNATDYYFAEITKGQSLKGTHRLQRIPDDKLLSDPLYKELFTVFTGSLHANNTAAMYGVEKIKETVRIMDEIAVPLGGPANPPETLKLVKVSTTPGQAVLFDHQTRMIVCQYPASTKTWTRSKEAPEPLRNRTTEIFNALFEKPLLKQNEQSALQISRTMKELQDIVRKKGRTMNQPRNIAYAEITLPGGKSEVYVSVSGRGGDTGYLPMFASHRKKEVKVGDTTYINVDHNEKFPVTSLDDVQGQLHAIPPTIQDISKYTPALTARPVSLDSESKLIRAIRAKYPDDATRGPVTVATTMAPCESCSVLMQQYAHTGGKDALKVIWD